MGFKFIVTAPIVPHQVGDLVEFETMPPQGMMFRLKPVEGSELVVATPQEPVEGAELDLTNRAAVVDELERLGIEFDGRKGLDYLVSLLP